MERVQFVITQKGIVVDRPTSDERPATTDGRAEHAAFTRVRSIVLLGISGVDSLNVSTDSSEESGLALLREPGRANTLLDQRVDL